MKPVHQQFKSISLSIFYFVGFCPIFRLWDFVLWDSVLWDFVLWDSVRIPFVTHLNVNDDESNHTMLMLSAAGISRTVTVDIAYI